MEQTISVKNFLDEVDNRLQHRDLEKVKALLVKLSDDDIKKPNIKKRVAVYLSYNGELNRAITLYEELLDSNPDDPDVYTNAFRVLDAAGQRDRAYELAGQAFDKFPENLTVSIAVGKLLVEQKQMKKALNLFTLLQKKNPDNLELMLLRGDCQFSEKSGDSGEAVYEKALKIAREKGDTFIQSRLLTALTSVYYRNAKDDDFLEVLKALAALDCRELYQERLLVEYYEKAGQMENMLALIEKCEKNYPGNDEFKVYKIAYYQRLKEEDALESLIGEVDVDSMTIEFRIKYYNECARFLESKGKFDEAFDKYTLTNELVIEQQGGAIENDRLSTQKANSIEAWTPIIKQLGQQFQQSRKAGEDERQPIFFVGFPRSGTTLIDQILTSHSKIEVIEEKPLITNVVEKIVANQKSYPSEQLLNMPEEESQVYRNSYFELLEYFRKDKTEFVVNKLPLNILHLPLIYTLFPKAKTIVALRHPLDSCLSCFCQIFGYNPAMANFVTMKGGLSYYGKVMNSYLAFRDTFSAPIHTVRYEDLVQDLEKEARALLAYIEAPWEDSVLRYYETARKRAIINTPSYTQVTQPIYKDSTYKWKNYQKQLAPFKPIVQRYIEEFGYAED